jgi:hypothetical protein
MVREIDGEEYLSIQAAAGELATTHLRLLMLVKQGTLAGKQVAGEWFIARESLECLKRHGLEPASVASCKASSCSSGGCGCR